MSLPTGTVTFLFTDIEGSTELWEKYPEEMRVALQRHDDLMRQAIDRHQGVVFKTIGDAFCVVFTTPEGAVHAALEVQLALRRNAVGIPDKGGELLPIRVRMALHTGQAEERDNDYFGPPLNRVARLLSTGYGGQVLLSEVTQGLLSALPEGADLLDLGMHRLKDLQKSERIYQLTHPELPGDFPPLRSLPQFLHNLPIQVTSFIGREQEMSEIKALLRTTRLLTLTGSGGAGKTRLAMQIAADLLDPDSDGVWLVELAALTDPERVAPTVAAVLNVREEPGRPILQTLTDYLRTKRLLLLLDNCEHVLDSCALLADSLIRHCPNVTILASSRQALGIAGELTYRVPSLSLPDPKKLPPMEALVEIESVRLFSDRARFHQPTFAITTANAPMLAQVCHQLDGIPLAIELAAARVRAMPVEQIADRLDDRFKLLTGGSRTALPRHQTLRAAMDWSYSLLPPAERTLLNRLSVFSGGWSLEAAEKICTDPADREHLPERVETPAAFWETTLTASPAETVRLEDWEILDLLMALVDKSLVVYEEQNGQARYRLLETLRQYLREKLTEAGESEAVQECHLAYYLSLTEESERKTRGSEQTWWLERLDREHDNLRAALNWPCTTEADTEAGLRLAGALWWFWHVRGHFTEGREWLSRKLAEASQASSYRAKALNGAAVLARNQGDYATARSFSQESLALKRQLQDKQGIAAALATLATLALMQADYGEARPLYEEALELERELGNRQGITAALIGLGNVALEQGEYDRARTLYQESLTLKKQLGDKRGIAASLVGLGSIAFAEGDLAAAQALHEESLTIRRHLRDKRNIATSLQHLGSVETTKGEFDKAEELFAESLEIRHELSDKLGIANAWYGQGILALQRGNAREAVDLFAQSLKVFRELNNRRGSVCSLNACAYTLAAQGKAQEATRLLGNVEAIRAELGSPLHPNEQPEYTRVVTELQGTLGSAGFASAWAEGRSLSLPKAIDVALSQSSG